MSRLNFQDVSEAQRQERLRRHAAQLCDKDQRGYQQQNHSMRTTGAREMKKKQRR